jgi:hypothetical protein
MRAFADTSVETAPLDGMALRDLEDSWNDQVEELYGDDQGTYLPAGAQRFEWGSG